MTVVAVYFVSRILVILTDSFVFHTLVEKRKEIRKNMPFLRLLPSLLFVISTANSRIMLEITEFGSSLDLGYNI